MREHSGEGLALAVSTLSNGSEQSTTAEGFESESEVERVKEKGSKIRSFSQVQNGVVWTFTVFFFFFFFK